MAVRRNLLGSAHTQHGRYWARPTFSFASPAHRLGRLRRRVTSAHLSRAFLASLVAGAGGFGLSRLCSGGKCSLAQTPVLAPRPPGARPFALATFSLPAAPQSLQPICSPSAPQPLAAMHVIKRGERPGRGRRAGGRPVRAVAGCGPREVSRAARLHRFPPCAPWLPALSACPLPHLASGCTASALPFCGVSKD